MMYVFEQFLFVDELEQKTETAVRMASESDAFGFGKVRERVQETLNALLGRISPRERKEEFEKIDGASLDFRIIDRIAKEKL